MRFKNSYAAAVAAAVSAVVFSAAFQPAEASFIWYAQNVTSPSVGVRIDGQGSFNTSTMSGTGPIVGPNNLINAAVTISSIASQGTITDNTDPENPLGFYKSFPGVFLSSSGTAIAPGMSNFLATPLTVTGDFVRFATRTSGSYSLQLDPAYVSGSPLSTSMFLEGYNMTTGVPTLGWSSAGTYANPVVSGSWTLSNGETVQIYSVPEPTQMVFVAGMAAALGAWRLRKLRRALPAAGDAIAG